VIPSAGGSLRLGLLRRLLVPGLVVCRFLDRRARLGLFVWLLEEFCPERGVSVEDDRSRFVLSAKADTVQCAQYAQHEHRPPLGQKTSTTRHMLRS